MDVKMSNEGKKFHDKLITELSKIPYIQFNEIDGKDKIFHVTLSSKKIKNVYNKLWNYINLFPCDFNCKFDNVCIYKWIENNWILHKEYIIKKF